MGRCGDFRPLLWTNGGDHSRWAVGVLAEFGQLLQENAADFQHAPRMAVNFRVIGRDFDLRGDIIQVRGFHRAPRRPRRR